MDGDPLLLNAILLSADAEISIWKVVLTLFLVFLNGFFVAAEFAIVKVRSSQIEVQTNVSKSVANVSRKIIDNLDAYLAATQLGITLASLGLGWVGESVMESIILSTLGNVISPELAAKLSLPIGFAIITILHIVFGELAPKSIAIQYPAKTTFTIAWPLRIFYFICRPIIWLMNGLAINILKIFGIKPIHGSDIHTEEELKVIISESQLGGAIEKTERDLIQNVFDFDDRRVSNIQTLKKNISAIDIALTPKEALELAILEGYSRYPVYEETLDNIKGIINTKDIMKYILGAKTEMKSLEPILRNATFIAESAKIKNVLKEFQTKRIQMALVTNEVGELAGMVTMEDILEELVGEIQDEYDNEKPIVEQTSDSTFMINAHHPLSDINKYIPFKLAEGEHYETLAGLLAEVNNGDELNAGDVFTITGYEATIIKMYRNSAETVQLKILSENENHEDDSIQI
jgi:CBS domain containing-hemolysin-like protein